MRRFFATACLIVACLMPAAMPSRAHAGDWRFRQSYHTHRLPREWRPYFPAPPPSRSAYRPAYLTPAFGFTIQGGYRINRVQINSGNSSDTTIFHEGWFRAR